MQIDGSGSQPLLVSWPRSSRCPADVSGRFAGVIGLIDRRAMGALLPAFLLGSRLSRCAPGAGRAPDVNTT